MNNLLRVKDEMPSRVVYNVIDISISMIKLPKNIHRFASFVIMDIGDLIS